MIPSVRPCSSRPTVVCHEPARSATASATMQRVEARIECERQLGRARTPTPSRCRPRFHGACTPRGRCGAFPGPSGRSASALGRSASNAASIGVRSRIRTSASASPIWAARSAAVSGRDGLHDHVVPFEQRECVESLDGPLVVLHHDDAHRHEPIAAPPARRGLRGRDPAWLLRSRLTLSRPAVSSFTPR